MSVGTFQSTSVAGELLNELVFVHRYSPPFGHSSPPTLNLAEPLMHTVVDYPDEAMSLLQVLVRVAGSAREPFRRAHVTFPSVESQLLALDEALSWALAYATESFGSALVPVALSVRAMVNAPDELEVIRQLSQRKRTFEASRRLLELAATADIAEADDLAALLAGGNAWLFIDDDQEATSDLTLVRKTLSTLFHSKSELSHVPIVVMTAKSGALLDHSEHYRFMEPPSPLERDRTRTSPPGSLIAASCRFFAYCGNPPAIVAFVVAIVLALPLVALAVTNYDGVYDLMKGGAATSLHLPVGANTVRTAVVGIACVFGFLVPIILGFIFALGYGSEAIRLGFLGCALVTFFAGLSLLLLLIPHWLQGASKLVATGVLSLVPALLIGLTVLQWVSFLADVLWLVLSNRAARRLIRSNLATASSGLLLELHLAEIGRAIVLGHSGYGRPMRLPLLICMSTREIVTVALRVAPRLSVEISRRIVLGLRKDAPDDASFGASALMLAALLECPAAVCQRTIERVADTLETEWDPALYTEHRLSGGVKMNALEYVGRRLCYLLRKPELVIVR